MNINDRSTASMDDEKVRIAVSNLTDYAQHRDEIRAAASPFVANFVTSADAGARQRFAEAFASAGYIAPKGVEPPSAATTFAMEAPVAPVSMSRSSRRFPLVAVIVSMARRLVRRPS